MSATTPPTPTPRTDKRELRRRMLLLAPLGIATLGGVSFLAMLRGMSTGSFDPRGVPSPLVGRRVPDFTLPGQSPDPQSPAGQGFGSADILALHRPMLVNFFASWCQPCLIEHPLLMGEVRQMGLPLWGIAYKDTPAAVAAFLQQHGDPYGRIASDQPGRVAIDWGVYGVPETYFIDRDGIVRWRWAGPITPDTMAQDLRPLARKYT